MRDIIITSSVLILAILLIRYLVKGKVHPLLQYALWLLVVVRLVLPVSLWNSPVSVLNLFPEVQQQSVLKSIEAQKDEKYAQYLEQVQNAKAASDVEAMPVKEVVEIEISELSELSESDAIVSEMADETWNVVWQEVLMCIWFAGIYIVGGYMLFYQIKWKRYLYANRKPLKSQKVYHGLAVYTVKGLPSPCLSGKSIYLTKEMAADEKRLSHILAHEYCHYKQGDSAWVIIRCVLIAVYWFHPLVWVAAYVSKQDSELACDEAAIRLLGEGERFSYGKTLLKLISKETFDRKRIGIASTMSGKENGIRERISRIAGENRYFPMITGLVMAVAVVVAGMTFAGADVVQNESEQEEAAVSEEVVKQEQAALENVVEKTETEAEHQAVLALLDSYDEQIAADGFHNARKPQDFVQAYAEQGASALEEGLYLLEKTVGDDGKAINIYGIYSEAYGCRGITIYRDGDSNKYDMSWIPGGGYLSEEKLVIYESEEKGEPRTFAWKQPVVNRSDSEIWNLYLCDRYDTGTIEVNEFRSADYLHQIQERVSFEVVQDEDKIYVYDKAPDEEEPVLVGTIDFAFAEVAGREVEDVILDGSVISFRLGSSEAELQLVAGIGLKFEGVEEIWYHRLNLISFPVECGTFGERNFILGKANVETEYVNGMLQSK